MHTSVALVALAGLVAAAPAAPSPSWLTDYAAARAQGRRQDKPLAVFVGTGKEGWKDVCREGRLGNEAQRLLADRYVCVYVDASKRSGRDLAADFEMNDGLGIVLSDHTGQLQAFRHEGDLSSQRLAEQLRRFADPDRVVRATETNEAREVRYYPAEVAAPPVYAPVLAPPPLEAGFVPYGGFGGGFGGSFGGGRSC